MKWNAKTIIHDSFTVLISFKGLYALLETIAAGLVFLFRRDAVANYIFRITADGLWFDRQHWIADQLIAFANSYTFQTQVYAALYLLSHGLIKIFLVVNLWRRKLWAYPTAIIVFVLFVIYQVYLYIFNHSLALVLFTILDFIVIWLTYLEYQQIKKSDLFAKRS